MKILAPSLLFLAPLAAGQEPAKPPPPKPYKLGVQVPPIRLPDLDEKSTVVVDEDTDSVTVIVFWSLRDPISRAYAPKLEAIRRDYADKGVRLFLIDSNKDELEAGNADPLDKIKKYVHDENVRIPILLDRENVIADDFGAPSANQVYVLGSTRKLVYMGGIDDDPRGDKAEQGLEVRTWLRDALDATLRGEAPEAPWTRPTGRPIKRWPKAGEKGR